MSGDKEKGEDFRRGLDGGSIQTVEEQVERALGFHEQQRKTMSRWTALLNLLCLYIHILYFSLFICSLNYQF